MSPEEKSIWCFACEDGGFTAEIQALLCYCRYSQSALSALSCRRGWWSENRERDKGDELSWYSWPLPHHSSPVFGAKWCWEAEITSSYRLSAEGPTGFLGCLGLCRYQESMATLHWVAKDEVIWLHMLLDPQSNRNCYLPNQLGQS